MKSFALGLSTPDSRSDMAAAGLPPLFGAALGLAFILPFLNFLRVEPMGDFFGEWSCAIALSVATFAIVRRLPASAPLNWSVLAIPGLIVAMTLTQVALGKYVYAADWMFWVAYLWIASFAMLLGQVLGGTGWRREVAARIAWALVLAAGVNFLLQVLQAARMDVEFSPFVVHLREGLTCQLFGNVGQTNHANTLAWLGIAGLLYLFAISRIGVRSAAALLSLLLLSSALTVSRMAWLILAATATLLAFRQIWPTFSGRSRVMLISALIAGFAVASWGSGTVRANIDRACVSGIDRIADVKAPANAVRPMLWRQAIEVWETNPWIGVGAGGFIGAVYRMDAGEGHQPLDSWAHNTALQLLAEFGLIVTAGLGTLVLLWFANLVRNREDLTTEDGFCLAGLAVLGIHSMLEFPLWYVHFLSLASILIGLLVRPGWSRFRLSFPARPLLLAMAATIAIGSAVLAIDYRKLDRLFWISEFIQGVGPERMPDAQSTLEDAAAQVVFFSQFRDYSFALGRPLNKENLENRIATVDRALGRMPNINLIHVRVLLAALAGDPGTARLHLRRALKFHPQHAEALADRIRARIKSRPDDFALLAPILDEEFARRPKARW